MRLWKKKIRRDIFAYWDGARNRSIDPLIAFEAMETHQQCDWERDAEDGNADDKPDYESRHRFLQMMCDVFDVTLYLEGEKKENGLTVDEIYTLFYMFLHYMTQRKKKRDDSQTKSQRSDSKSCPKSSAESQPTPKSSDSVCTDEESTCEEGQSS